MNRELVINVSSSEIVIALLEDKQLVELRKEKKNIKFSVGDIYLAKVKKIMPGLNAAFVDVGYEKDAFLHYLDLGHHFLSFNKFLNLAVNSKQKLPALSKVQIEPDINKDGKITDVLKQGQTILVQIAKEPISTKGPRLSSEISIAGRNIVLLPFTDKVSISQKIKSQEEKVRLKRLLQSIKPKNYGVIVRTVAESKKVANFDGELRELVAKWEVALNKIRSSKPPQLIIGELKQTSAILRDMLNSSFNNIFVNDEASYLDIVDFIKTIAPEKQNIVNYYKGGLPIFEQYGIEKQIKAHFGKNVALKKGAYLIIEHTEAFHVIDVNSGNRTQSDNNQEANAIDVNLLAAEEIASQLRLRDMGGIIVIDYIDMHNYSNRQLLYERMKELMVSDRAKHHVLPLSKFGLMQITRQRVRPVMDVQVLEKCPTCGGTGKITPTIFLDTEIENNILWNIKKIKGNKLIIRVHPYLASYLTKGLFSIRVKWCFMFKKIIKIIPMSSYSYLEYHFFSNDSEIPVV